MREPGSQPGRPSRPVRRREPDRPAAARPGCQRAALRN